MKMIGSVHAGDDRVFRSYGRPQRGMTIGHALVLALMVPIFVLIETGNRASALVTHHQAGRARSRSLLAAAVAEAKIAVSYIFIGRDMMK